MYRLFADGVGAPRFSADTVTAVRELSQDFCTAFNTGNYDQVAALFASEALYMPPHRTAAHGPKAIERVLREFGDAGYHGLRLETTRVSYSGDMAIEAGVYAVTIQQGSTTIADRGKYLRSWRRLGAWLITAECWNSDLPVPGQALPGQGLSDPAIAKTA